jgi:hypothetical protein
MLTRPQLGPPGNDDGRAAGLQLDGVERTRSELKGKAAEIEALRQRLLEDGAAGRLAIADIVEVLTMMP